MKSNILTWWFDIGEGLRKADHEFHKYEFPQELEPMPLHTKACILEQLWAMMNGLA